MLVVAPSALPFPIVGNDIAVSVPTVGLAGSSDAGPWRIEHEGRAIDLLPEPKLRLSSILMVRDAVLSGIGAALLPRWLVAGDIAAGRLVCWGVSDRTVSVWA